MSRVVGHHFGAEVLEASEVLLQEVEAAVADAVEGGLVSAQLLSSVLRDAATTRMMHMGEIAEGYENLRCYYAASAAQRCASSRLD